MTRDGKPIHAITSMAATEAMDSIILLAFPKERRELCLSNIRREDKFQLCDEQQGPCMDDDGHHVRCARLGHGARILFPLLGSNCRISCRGARIREIHAKRRSHRRFYLHRCRRETSPCIEGTADHFHLRDSGDRGETGPFVVQTNHLVDPSLSAYNPKWLPVIGTYARYDTVFQYLKEAAPGSVDFAFTKNLFASDDWFEAGKNTWNKNQPGRRELSNSHTSVSQAIFFPADLVAYLANGDAERHGPSHFRNRRVRQGQAGNRSKDRYLQRRSEMPLPSIGMRPIPSGTIRTREPSI